MVNFDRFHMNDPDRLMAIAGKKEQSLAEYQEQLRYWIRCLLDLSKQGKLDDWQSNFVLEMAVLADAGAFMTHKQKAKVKQLFRTHCEQRKEAPRG